MYVYHMSAVTAEARRPLGLLHLRLQVAMSCPACLSLPELSLQHKDRSSLVLSALFLRLGSSHFHP